MRIDATSAPNVGTTLGELKVEGDGAAEATDAPKPTATNATDVVAHATDAEKRRNPSIQNSPVNQQKQTTRQPDRGLEPCSRSNIHARGTRVNATPPGKSPNWTNDRAAQIRTI